MTDKKKIGLIIIVIILFCFAYHIIGTIISIMLYKNTNTNNTNSNQYYDYQENKREDDGKEETTDEEQNEELDSNEQNNKELEEIQTVPEEAVETIPNFKYDIAFKHHEKWHDTIILIDIHSNDIMIIQLNKSRKTANINVNYSEEYSYTGDANTKITIKTYGVLVDDETDYVRENDSLIEYFDNKPYDVYEKYDLKKTVELLEKYAYFNIKDYPANANKKK